MLLEEFLGRNLGETLWILQWDQFEDMNFVSLNYMKRESLEVSLPSLIYSRHRSRRSLNQDSSMFEIPTASLVISKCAPSNMATHKNEKASSNERHSREVKREDAKMLIKNKREALLKNEINFKKYFSSKYFAMRRRRPRNADEFWRCLASFFAYSMNHNHSAEFKLECWEGKNEAQKMLVRS